MTFIMMHDDSMKARVNSVDIFGESFDSKTYDNYKWSSRTISLYLVIIVEGPKRDSGSGGAGKDRMM
jgi:hypothetical protein